MSRPPSRPWLALAAASVAVAAFAGPMASVDAMIPASEVQAAFGRLRSEVITRDVANALTVYQHMHSSRRLEASTEQQATDKASQVGASVRKGIKQLRGGTDKFYNDLITAVQIKLCEEDDTNKVRFVSKSDDRAYVDDAGECIKLANAVDPETLNAYNLEQKCEVKPNCYWADFDAAKDTDRETKYAESETMTAADADSKLYNYGRSLLMFVVPGAILAVLSLLTMIFFLICRCCCNKCGGRKPREGGYTRTQKFLPTLFFLLFGIGIGACAGAAFLYRTVALDGISATFDGISHTIGNASEWTYELSQPLEHIRDTIVASADSVSTSLSGMDDVSGDMDTLVGMLNAIGTDVTGVELPSGCASTDPVCIQCVACDVIGAEVTAAATEIDNNAGPVAADLDKVHTELNDLLVNIVDDVKGAVNAQADVMNGVRDSLDLTQSQIDTVRGYFDDYKAYIGYAILFFFAVGLAIVVVGLIGVLFGFTPFKILANIMHVAYVLGFIALFVCFLISAIMLAVSVVMGDMCEIVDILSQNWTIPLGEDTGKVVDACFQNQSLLEVFNLTDKFSFARGGINFPTLDMDSATNFGALNTLGSTVSGTTAENTFPIADELDASLTTLNSLTAQNNLNTQCIPNDGGNYGTSNILTPWIANSESDPGVVPLVYMQSRYGNFETECAKDNDPTNVQYTCEASTCSYVVAVGESYSSASGLYTAQVESETFVSQLQADMTAVTTFSSSFTTKMDNMAIAVNSIRANLEASLIMDVQSFENAMYCTFVVDGFDEIFAALCGDLMPALTMLSLLLYLVGFFLIPVNVCLIILSKRLKARGNGGHVMDNEMKFK